MSMADQETVLAAGVVLLRGSGDETEFLAVHRPHRSDWSLPKGKLEPGEHVINAAIRECDEETGHQVTLGARLPTQSYTAMGLPKQVDYWVARSTQDEGFIPHEEIDDLRWVLVSDASNGLTYGADAELVAQAAALPATSPLVILRHTQAVKRSDFKGKVDAERPITGRGRSQAKAVVPLLEAFGISEVHSSPSTRCHQSVRKLAKSLTVPVLHDAAFSEEGHADDSDRTAKHARRLLANPLPLMLCTHRPVMPTILDALRDASDTTGIDENLWDPKMPPGAFVVIHRAFEAGREPRIIAVERHRTTIDE